MQDHKAHVLIINRLYSENTVAVVSAQLHLQAGFYKQGAQVPDQPQGRLKRKISEVNENDLGK